MAVPLFAKALPFGGGVLMSIAENQERLPELYKMLGLGNEENLGIPVAPLKEPLRADTSQRVCELFSSERIDDNAACKTC